MPKLFQIYVVLILLVYRDSFSAQEVAQYRTGTAKFPYTSDSTLHEDRWASQRISGQASTAQTLFAIGVPTP